MNTINPNIPHNSFGFPPENIALGSGPKEISGASGNPLEISSPFAREPVGTARLSPLEEKDALTPDALDRRIKEELSFPIPPWQPPTEPE